ncbi:CopD family protein [Kribbella sp. NPDC051770]|uniref:CopD family protein n=1 Tax=Kribbella sp. NPDC051770 TaxID=3155413 RepID=UPI003444D2BA
MAIVLEVAYAYPQLWRILTKSCYFLSTGLAGGSVLFHTFVLRPVLNRTENASDRRVLRNRSAILLAIAGTALLLATYPQFAGKVTRATKGMEFSEGMAPSAIWDYLQTAAPKNAWWFSGVTAGLQALIYSLGALLLMSLFLKPVRRHVDKIAGVGVAVILIAALFLMVPSRPADLEAAYFASHLVTTLHPYSGGYWIGGLLVLSGLALSRRQLDTGSGGLIWASVWSRFSIMAQACVTILLVSGLLETWMAVGSVSVGDILSTTYGKYLLLKVLLVFSILGLGAFNEAVLLPKIARVRAAGDRRGLFHLVLGHFPKVVLIESVLGLGVLAVMPFLNGSAREEVGLEADPPPTGGVALAMVLLFVALVVSFVARFQIQKAIEARAEGRTAEPEPEAEAAEAG